MKSTFKIGDLVEAVWDQDIPYPIRLRGVVVGIRQSDSLDGEARGWNLMKVYWINYINKDFYEYYDEELILISEA